MAVNINSSAQVIANSAGSLQMQSGIKGTPISLLELYPNARAAYSLRRLTYDWTGSAVRVRRSSDNTEQDIGFKKEDRTFDTESLSTFVGASSGYVTIWYDQSGNDIHATQSVQANQPRIVSGGVIQTTGTRPSMLFGTADGSNSRHLTTLRQIISGSRPRSIFTVQKLNTTSTNVGSGCVYALNFVGSGVTRGQGWSLNIEQSNAHIRTLDFSSYTYPAGQNSVSRSLVSTIFGGGSVADISMSWNGTTMVQSFASDPPPSINTIAQTHSNIGRYWALARHFEGTMQELVFYESNQTASQAGIEANILKYYNLA